ncbi:MAG: glycoside hydrolase N-terminal domain-containing protein, partial [bacterium]|nr:glycoside hydrolase N-terminal domain-containing protein [bacterium]
MVIQYTADQPAGLNATFVYVPQRPEDQLSVEGEHLVFRRTLANGISCEARVCIQQTGGTLRQEGETLVLQDATTCTLIVAIETNYQMDATTGFRGESPATRIEHRLNAIKKQSVECLKARHQADYKALYNRLQLDLGASPETAQKQPTYQRLAAYRKGDGPHDVGLEETLFNFGRYLMICTSRPGSLPAGLQGIWNNMTQAPWGNDYHSNINFQMVYWLAETGNLSDCHLAMLDYLNAMREPFRANTRDYLSAIGEPPETPAGEWLVYTSHNPFGGGGWQVNLPGAAWYGLHFWEHYAFTQDKDYLRQQAYPIMKELCAYWMKHLKPLGKGGVGFQSNYQPVDVTRYPELLRLPEGLLVVPNGWSPEHGPRGEDGVAHDQQIVSELFLKTINAAEILDVDHAWVETLKTLQQRLLPSQIGRQGNLMEWMIDRDPSTDHRHTSHLFAVFPGSTINMETTPTLANAARRSLELRKTTGDSRRSWAWTWRSMLWARLHEGDKAHAMLQGLITHNMLDNLFTTHHLPLQIDGNYGIAAAMLEMLVQSHTGTIELLPARPAAWPSGSVKGLKARGNIEVEMQWHNGEVTHWRLSSPHRQTVTVKVNNTYHTVHL